jgi:hypothetical protein
MAGLVALLILFGAYLAFCGALAAMTGAIRHPRF